MDPILDLISAVVPLFKLFWPIWVPAILIFLGRVVLKLYKNAQLAKSGIAELDQLGGEDFEKYLEILFRKLNYKVTRTPYQGDYGADLVIQKDGVQTVVQAKRYTRTVGVKAIQEAVAAKDYYKCTKAMVVTNSSYSQQAKQLAAANQVELWDRDQLVKRLLAVKQMSAPTATQYAPPPELVTPQMATVTPQSAETAVVCATCGKPVSPKVADYCLSHQTKFGGQVYCYEHQRVARYSTVQTT